MVQVLTTKVKMHEVIFSMLPSKQIREKKVLAKALFNY
jgi:hypothetical protein